MNKILVSIVATLMLSIGATSGQSRLGGNLNYDFDADAVGIGVRYTTAFGDFRLAPEVIMFFPEGGTLWDLNANVNYVFPLLSRLGLYPLAGLNFAIASADGNSSSDFGLNLGLGAEYALTRRMNGYVELRGVLQDNNRSMIGIGLSWEL